MSGTARPWVYWWAALTSTIEHYVRRYGLVANQPRKRYAGPNRRVNPRACPLCGGPLRPDSRPPRDQRDSSGKIRRLPADVLAWFRCGRCEASQIGIHPSQLDPRRM